MWTVQRHEKTMRSSIPVQGANFNAPDAPPGLMSAPSNLRAGLLAFGVLLGLGGIWLIAPELLAPTDIRLASGKDAAVALAPDFPRAIRAARAAQIRGDLWAGAAFTDSSLLWLDRSAPPGRATLERIDRARSNAEAGLALAPINGAAWLLIHR